MSTKGQLDPKIRYANGSVRSCHLCSKWKDLRYWWLSIADVPGLKTVEVYDPSTDTWTTKAPMPTGRRQLAASVVNGKIYAIGGYVNKGQPGLATVEEYNPITDV